MHRVPFLVGIHLFLLIGCASFVHKYEYGSLESAYIYPPGISVGYSPAYIPLTYSPKYKVGAGMDLSYLIVPMGSNVFLYNKDKFFSIRIGNQWSTIDNEVIGVEFLLGGNYFLEKSSVFTIGAGYTTLNLTPRDIVSGKILGLFVKLSKVLFYNQYAQYNYEPLFTSIYFVNNLKRYDFKGVLELHVYDSSYTTYIVEYRYPSFKDYLWSFGMGVDTKFKGFAWYTELGKVFPRYMYDTNSENPIRYDYYLSSGLYLNF